MYTFKFNDLFKYSFTFAVIFMLLNIKVLTGVDTANAIEKFFFLITGFLLVSRHHNTDVLLVLSVLVLITLFSALFSINPSFSWGVYLKALTQVFIIFFLCSGKLVEQEKGFLLKFFAWLPVIMLGLGIIYALAGIRGLFSWEFVSGLPRLQLTLIPAFVGGLSIATTYAALKCADKYNYNYFWLFALNVLVLLLTSARMALLLSVLLSSFVFFTHFKGQKNLKWLVVILSMVILLIVGVVAGEIIFSRLAQTHLSGRDLIWQHLHIISELYPDFGVGFGHQIYFMPREVTILTGGTIGAHNEYIRVKTEIGHFPSILFFCCIALVFILVALNEKCVKPAEVFLAGFCFLLFCYFDNALSSPAIFMFAVLVVLINSPSYIKVSK